LVSLISLCPLFLMSGSSRPLARGHVGELVERRGPLRQAAERVIHRAIALTDATLIAAVEREAGDVDRGDGNADEVFPFATYHVALRDVLAQPLADLTADNVTEPSVVLINL
jgi:hypothetical protein